MNAKFAQIVKLEEQLKLARPTGFEPVHGGRPPVDRSLAIRAQLFALVDGLSAAEAKAYGEYRRQVYA